MPKKPVEQKFNQVQALTAASEGVLECKRQEAAWKKDRGEHESMLLKVCGLKQEGSQTTNEGGFKVVTTQPYTYTVDKDDTPAIFQILGEKIYTRLIQWEPKISVKDMKYIRDNEPETWAQIQKFITSKAQNPRVAVTRLEQ